MTWSEFGFFMQNHLPFCEVLPCLSPSPFVLRASFQRSASSPDAPQPAPDPLTIEQAIHINPQCHSARLLPPWFNMIQFQTQFFPLQDLWHDLWRIQRVRMFEPWGAFCRASLKLGRISSFSSRPRGARLQRERQQGESEPNHAEQSCVAANVANLHGNEVCNIAARYLYGCHIHANLINLDQDRKGESP